MANIAGPPHLDGYRAVGPVTLSASDAGRFHSDHQRLP
jgi:hypothetical protein